MNIQHHRIRAYAYQIWEFEGQPEGQEQRHWDLACKLAQDYGAAINLEDDVDSCENNVVNFEDSIANVDLSYLTHSAPTELLTQLNPYQPLQLTEPAKSLVDTGPITAPLTAMVKNIAPAKAPKLKKPKVTENEVI